MSYLLSKYDIKLSDIALLVFPIVLGLGLVSIVVRKETICGKKPKLQPPGWVFGAAWGQLYTLMGISIFFYWRKSGRKTTIPFYLFIIGVILLQLWWIIFNKICAPKYAFISLVLLAVFFLVITLSFYKTSNVATFCLIPLLGWLSFASYLTYETI